MKYWMQKGKQMEKSFAFLINRKGIAKIELLNIWHVLL